MMYFLTYHFDLLIVAFYTEKDGLKTSSWIHTTERDEKNVRIPKVRGGAMK